MGRAERPGSRPGNLHTALSFCLAANGGGSGKFQEARHAPDQPIRIERLRSVGCNDLDGLLGYRSDVHAGELHDEAVLRQNATLGLLSALGSVNLGLLRSDCLSECIKANRLLVLQGALNSVFKCFVVPWSFWSEEVQSIRCRRPLALAGNTVTS